MGQDSEGVSRQEFEELSRKVEELRDDMAKELSGNRVVSAFTLKSIENLAVLIDQVSGRQVHGNKMLSELHNKLIDDSEEG